MKYLLCVLLCSTACGQELDGICQISHVSKQGSATWCGVAVSSDTIVTIAHHGVTGEVRLDFCVDKHGSPVRVSMPGLIVRSDKKRDLSLIRFRSPEWLRIKTYRVGRLKGRPAIRGFLHGSCETREGTLGREGLTVDGFPVVEIVTTCEQGLSGSPLIDGDTVGGVLIGSGDGVSHLVSPETILEWVK
jgi:hypothetical protein